MSEKNKDRFMALYSPVHAQFERFCRARAYKEYAYNDLMHDTILTAFEKIDDLKNEKAFLSFLFGISTRILANFSRKKKEERSSESQFSTLSINNEAPMKLEIQHLYQCLAKLDDISRDCIILAEISGFQIKEVAEIKNLSVDAVKQRLSRGRRQLHELMQEKNVQVA